MSSICLPDGDGFSLFRSLRAEADIPALFLSARDADADRLFGLGLGADYYGYENSLGVHIRHLRQKLEENPSAPRFLLTVRGIGYKLVC